MKKCFLALTLLTISQTTAAHQSATSAGTHLVEHSMVPAIWLLAVAVVVAIKNKRFK